ncbi:MAG: DUF433 domain-containing protein [Blastocatellales bacterium]
MEPVYQDNARECPPEYPPPTSIDQYVVSNPGVKGGTPSLAGTRISVADLVIMHLRMGQSLEEIAATYDLPLAAVHAGMAYYYDHRSQVDQSIEQDRAFAEAFRQNNPSPLKEKLEALARG